MPDGYYRTEVLVFTTVKQLLLHYSYYNRESPKQCELYRIPKAKSFPDTSLTLDVPACKLPM